MTEQDLETRKAIADETRKRFLRPGEKFEGYHLLHQDRSDRGEWINWQYFTNNENKDKEYRTAEDGFVIPQEPERVMNMEGYLQAVCGQVEQGVRAYAVYSKPRY